MPTTDKRLHIKCYFHKKLKKMTKFVDFSGNTKVFPKTIFSFRRSKCNYVKRSISY